MFPSITPILGGTEAEAHRKYDQVAELLSIDIAIKFLSRYFSFFDFTQFALDEPLPDLGDIGKEGFKSTTETYKRLAREEKLTLRQLALRSANPGKQFVGTPEQVADRLQQLFEDEVVDGFILNAHLQPLGLREFVEQVVPILQRRGVYRTDYEATTLRSNLQSAHPDEPPCQGRSAGMRRISAAILTLTLLWTASAARAEEAPRVIRIGAPALSGNVQAVWGGIGVARARVGSNKNSPRMAFASSFPDSTAGVRWWARRSPTARSTLPATAT